MPALNGWQGKALKKFFGALGKKFLALAIHRAGIMAQKARPEGEGKGVAFQSLTF